MKTRKQASQEIYVLYNSIEVRPVSFKTIYNRVFKSGDACALLVTDTIIPRKFPPWLSKHH